MFKKKSINYLVMSDFHLGHMKNHTINIIGNLDLFFIEHDSILSKLDIIFIAGDIFERLLSANSKDYTMAIDWLTKLATYCRKNNIKYRILDGTHSHDFGQAKILKKIFSSLKIKIDFEFIDTMAIEHMSDLGLNILYIPDEWHPKAEDTYKDVLDILREHNLTEVDIVIMHGQFHFQLPMVVLPSSHNEEDYLSITKYFISAGHIHTANIFSRILGQGSFDRLAHGEEGDKGCMYITLNRDKESTYKFLKNKHAKVFKTVTVEDTDSKKLIAKLDKVLAKLPDGSHIRLKMSESNPIRMSILDIKNRYYRFHFTVKPVEDKQIKNTEQENIIVMPSNSINNVSITNTNITKLLMEELSKHKLSDDDLLIVGVELDLVI